MHIKESSIIYCLPEDLELLESNRVFIDGTFRPCAYLKPNYYQLVNLSIKKESDDGQRTFVYPVVSALVKSQSQECYNELFRNVKELFMEKFQRELVISEVNTDQVS